MENTYRELKTDSELLAAAIMQIFVYVIYLYDLECISELSGIIEAFTTTRVKINNCWYTKGDFSFHVLYK